MLFRSYVTFIIFTACLYIPLNRSLSGGVTLDLQLDRFVPLWPVWVVPYLLCLPAWALGLLWVSLKTDDQQFRIFVCAALFANLFAAMFYFFYPTYVDRPLLTGSGWAFKLLGMVYQNDRVYTSRGHKLRFFKELKKQGDQRFEIGLVGCHGFLQTL